MFFQHRSRRLSSLAGTALMLGLTAAASGQVTFTIVGNNWPPERRVATEIAATAAVARYNEFGGFSKNITIQYNPSVGTADGNFNGNIRIGPTVGINERLLIHEINHTLGIGTTGGWQNNRSGNLWSGQEGLERIAQFEGDGAVLNTDSIHFFPYGLNFNNEDSEINRQRSIAMMYAMQADMGLGPAQHPAAQPFVFMTTSDPEGESSFRRDDRWNDGYFPRENALYYTSEFLLRTPTGINSWTFFGDGLVLTNSLADTGLRHTGLNPNATLTFGQLILAGGRLENWTPNRSAMNVVGPVTATSSSSVTAKQGDVVFRGPISGGGSILIGLTDFPNEDRRYVRFESPDSTFDGDLIVWGRFELAEGAAMNIVIDASGANNGLIPVNDAIQGGTRGVRMNGTLRVEFGAANARPGDAWHIVGTPNTTYGQAFAIAGFAETSPGVWQSGTGLTFDQSTGLLVAEAPCADADENGTLDFLDVIAHLAASDAGDTMAADLAPLANTDGLLDERDTVIFLESLAKDPC